MLRLPYWYKGEIVREQVCLVDGQVWDWMDPGHLFHGTVYVVCPWVIGTGLECVLA